jgi:predicted DNA-binding protein
MDPGPGPGDRGIALVLPSCQDGVTFDQVKGITIKLPEEVLRRLRREAHATGRSVASLVRQRLEEPLETDKESVYALTSDMVGALEGRHEAATNQRRKFRRR